MQKYSHGEFEVTGLKTRITNGGDMTSEQVGAAWMKFMADGLSDSIQDKEFPGVHVLYFNYENVENPTNRSYDMIIGFLTKTGATQTNPEIMTVKIPAQNYEYLEIKGNMPTCVIDGWKQINALSPDECARTYQFDLDMYTEDRTAVTLTVSVK